MHEHGQGEAWFGILHVTCISLNNAHPPEAQIDEGQLQGQVLGQLHALLVTQVAAQPGVWMTGARGWGLGSGMSGGRAEGPVKERSVPKPMQSNCPRGPFPRVEPVTLAPRTIKGGRELQEGASRLGKIFGHRR